MESEAQPFDEEPPKKNKRQKPFKSLRAAQA
jgi:hypothetical protein